MSGADSDSETEEVPKTEEVKEEVVEDVTANNPDVLTKYQEAAKIAQFVLFEIIKLCVPGAKIIDICKKGDELIEEKVATVFKGKSKTGKVVLKGVAFPVCISVNDVICHCTPLTSDETYAPLQSGDSVKIDLGVHIDGFIAVTAHTIFVDEGSLDKATLEAKSDVIDATWTAAEVALKLIRPGNTNSMVSAGIKQVADLFDVRALSGTVMHQMKQFVIDGNKMVLLREEPDQKVDACTFELAEVYAVDIAMSNGEGKPKEMGNRTTVYKRAVEQKYSLKNKSSRAFFNDVNKRFPTMPFTLRAFPDETSAKMGVRECVTHQLLQPYPVLSEQKDKFVAHVKVTVILLKNGNIQVTGLPPVTSVKTSELLAAGNNSVAPLYGMGKVAVERYTARTGKTADASLLEILNTNPEPKKKANKKK